MIRKPLLVILIVLLFIAIAIMSVTIWWAKTVVSTSETALEVERQNVANVKVYAESMKKALDAKTQEAASLRAELERQQKAPPTPSK